MIFDERCKECGVPLKAKEGAFASYGITLRMECHGCGIDQPHLTMIYPSITIDYGSEFEVKTQDAEHVGLLITQETQAHYVSVYTHINYDHYVTARHDTHRYETDRNYADTCVWSPTGYCSLNGHNEFRDTIKTCIVQDVLDYFYRFAVEVANAFVPIGIRDTLRKEIVKITPPEGNCPHCEWGNAITEDRYISNGTTICDRCRQLIRLEDVEHE